MIKSAGIMDAWFARHLKKIPEITIMSRCQAWYLSLSRWE
jgi:hypothetical protein